MASLGSCRALAAIGSSLGPGKDTAFHPVCATFKLTVSQPLQPERFVNLGIEPPKGVLLFGPPGTGKTLCARAVANRTDACFIRVIGSELVQKYVGEVRKRGSMSVHLYQGRSSFQKACSNYT